MFKHLKRYCRVCILLGMFFPVLSGCQQEAFSDTPTSAKVSLSLNVETKKYSKVGQETPISKESMLHTLRVYAFVNGKLVGHSFQNLNQQGVANLLMDVDMISTKPHNIDFYLVANENSFGQAGVSSQQLTERTTERELQNYSFTERVTGNGLPMFCKETKLVDFSNVSKVPSTVPGHEGHFTLAQVYTFELQRSIAKLNVFAAKMAGESSELQVTGVKILKEGYPTSAFLFPQTEQTLKDKISFIVPQDFVLQANAVTVTKVIDPNATEAVLKNPENYTSVLPKAYYLLENPFTNGGSWDIKGDPKGLALQVDYSFNNTARVGYVYLPAVKRNQYVTVCCRMSNDGKIIIEYNVADWYRETDFDLNYDYPHYSNPMVPSLEPNIQRPYTQNKIHFNDDPASKEGLFIGYFKITEPSGIKWTPVLYEESSKDYEVTVYNAVTNELVSQPCRVSQDPFRIEIRAKNKSNVNKVINLGVVYMPVWDPGNYNFLIINGSIGDTYWEGSDNPNLIQITQTDIMK